MIGESPFKRPSPEYLARVTNFERLKDAADRIVGGELPYFSNQWFKRKAWNENPVSAQSIPWKHWTEISDFVPEQGDIKWIWEASRFYWVYTLGRQYALSLDDRYSEAFWLLLEDWRAHNTPNKGPNWKCAQECAHRLCALVWAATAFSGAPSSTEGRQKALWQTVTKLARRIEPTLGYGISQNNNHALTEGTAMLLAGISCKCPEAARWKQIGRRNVNRFILEQFAEDGSQAQSAFNYHRLALKVSVVSAAVAKSLGEPFPPEVIDRLGKAGKFLGALAQEGGVLPNYGSNDGAMAFPLSDAHYPDYRPVIQCAALASESKRAFEDSNADSEILWLFGKEALNAPLSNWPAEQLVAKSGGYYTLRNENSFALVRCHTHNAWPAHADMLHCDIWIDGRNVAFDPGSYAYSDPNNWGETFKETRAHNTVTVDGQSQMRKARRFLWTDWTQSKLSKIEPKYFDGEHYGYRQLGLGVVHRRQIFAEGGDFLIVDDLTNSGSTPRSLELNWHLLGTDWNNVEGGLAEKGGLAIRVFGSKQHEQLVLKGEESFPDTGQSLYYGTIAPATVLRCSCVGQANVRLITAIGREAPTLQGDILLWRGQEVRLSEAQPHG